MTLSPTDPGLVHFPQDQFSNPYPFCQAALCAAIGLDDVLDGTSADRTAGIGHLLEFEPTRVAQTHMSTGVNHGVHHVLVADGALIIPGS